MNGSFVNLMADVRWSEQDITSRMEAMIRERCSATEELILHRKLLGATVPLLLAAAGIPNPGITYALSVQELQELAAYAAVCSDAQQAGRQARADWALLERVLAAESGTAELAADDTEGHDLLAARAARHPAEEPVNEGNNDGQEGPVPADGTPAGA